MAQRYFYFDQTRCRGCNTCAVACKDWNNVNLGPVKWRSVRTETVGQFPVTQTYRMVYGCNHCADPACVTACATKAIFKDLDTGAVIIDRNKCVSLLACITACPYKAPQIADNKQEPTKLKGWLVPHPAQKCNMCFDRVSAQKRPMCADACISRALDWGTLEELESRHNNVNADLYKDSAPVKAFASDESTFAKLDGHTHPSIVIKKKA